MLLSQLENINNIVAVQIEVTLDKQQDSHYLKIYHRYTGTAYFSL